MNWPQITMIVLMGISLGTALAKDGKPRTDKYSFGISLTACVLHAWLLYMGGFFG